MLRRLPRLAPLLPLVGVIVFLALYATPTPLTDEWNFLRGAMRMSHARTWSDVCDSLVWHSYSHCVIVPYLFFYLPLEFLTGFDSRALMLLTVLCHAGLLITLLRRFAPPPWLMFGVSLVLFSPARYVELLWGFEFTIAMSIAFPVLGMYALDRVSVQDTAFGFSRTVATSILLLTCGVFSSAGAYLGFPAAIVLLAARRLPLRRKLAAASAILVAGGALYFVTIRLQGEVHPAATQILQVAVCAGGALLSGPIAFETFALNAPATLGLVVLACALIATFRAAQLGILDSAAFPLGLIAFGILASVAIAINRPYVANWHLEHMLPTIAGTLVLAWLVWKRGGRRVDGALCGIMFLTVLTSVSGWHYGFTRGGPEFHAYVRSIEQYIATYERDPGQSMPFPPMGPWSINHEMIAFLRAVDHPVLGRP